jgi:8-amino-7-oxononanoate synthase
MLLEHLQQQLNARDAQQLRRRLKTTQVLGSNQVRVWEGQAPSEPGQDCLAFCSNDYLGLAQHPEVVAALGEGARLYGAGSGASHLISGHSPVHAQLEADLARWAAPCIPDARTLFFSTGYLANLALLSTLGDGRATLFSDKLNHASLIDGALLAKGESLRYPHGSTERLANQLAACTTPIKLIVTDAVFSMDGDLAPLAELLCLADQHDAWLIVDDAHGFGVLGPQGRGSLVHLGLCSSRFIYMGTLGKAVGVAGAFVAAHPLVIDALLNLARPYIYTTAAPPAMAHAVRVSLQLIEGPLGDERRTALRQRQAQLREGLLSWVGEHGWSLGLPDASHNAPIQPLIVGDNATALALSAALQAQGLWVPAIRPPTVPIGSARLRITLSATHCEADVARLLCALEQAAYTIQPKNAVTSLKSGYSPILERHWGDIRHSPDG